MCWARWISGPGGKVPIANIFVVGVFGIGMACDMETPAEATSTEAVVKLRRRRFVQRPAQSLKESSLVNGWCQVIIDTRKRLFITMLTGYEAELHSQAGRARRRGGVSERCPASQFSQGSRSARRDAVGYQPDGARTR